MPPVVGLAIGGLAAATGAVGTIAGTVAAGLIDTFAIGEATAGIVGDVVAGAALGAAGGAASTAAAGGDPGQGALFGALTGGVTQGVTPVVSDIAPSLSPTAAQSIASGVSTTGVEAAMGVPIGTALQQGLVAGTGNYLGGQLVSQLNKLAAPTPADAGAATGTAPAGTQAPAAQGLPGAETVTATAQAPAPFVAGVSVPFRGAETVTTTADKQAAPATVVTAPETVVVSGEKQKPQYDLGSLLSDIQQSQTVQAIEKQGVSAALFDLLSGGSRGGQYAPSTTYYTGPGVSGAGTSAGAGAGAGAGATGAGTSTISPLAQAAISKASGQTGATSSYAPGGPITGGQESSKTQSPWNIESLRTALGT
jgi:hypothetical protein